MIKYIMCMTIGELSMWKTFKYKPLQNQIPQPHIVNTYWPDLIIRLQFFSWFEISIKATIDGGFLQVMVPTYRIYTD